MTKSLPPLDDEVIEWLQAQFPNTVPSIDARDRDVWAAVGQQQVIAQLRVLALKIARQVSGPRN